MTEDQFHAHRTTLANNFAAAGAELLEFMRAPGTLAAIPNTSPEQYAVAGDLVAIQALLPNRRERRGQRPKDELYFGPEAGQPRRWSILITESGKGVVADYGYRFPEASAELERVDVVEATPPATTGASTADLKVQKDALVKLVRKWAKRAGHAEGYASELEANMIAIRSSLEGQYDAEIGEAESVRRAMAAWKAESELGEKYKQMAYSQVGASTVLTDERLHKLWAQVWNGNADINLPLTFGRLVEHEVAAQAGQVAVPEWRGIKAVLTSLIAVASVRIADKDEDDEQLIADAEEAVRQLEARIAAAPSAPAVAQQAPADEYKPVGKFLFTGWAYEATSSDDPRGITLYRPAQASTPAERQEDGDRG